MVLHFPFPMHSTQGDAGAGFDGEAGGEGIAMLLKWRQRVRSNMAVIPTKPISISLYTRNSTTTENWFEEPLLATLLSLTLPPPSTTWERRAPP